MKKLLPAIVALLTAALLCACALRYDETNISRLYDGEWMIGRSRGEIEEKYGEFDREFTSDDGRELGAYYVNYDNRGLDPSYIHDTYFVEFDADDVAIDAYFARTSIGG